MSKKLNYLASMVNVLNLEVCKTYSIRSARKVSLFRDFVLAVFLSFACSLLTAMPVAYGQEGYALEVGGGRTVTIDDEDVLRLSSYTYEFWMKDLEGPTGSWRNVFCKGPGDTNAGRGPLFALWPSENRTHFSHSTGSGQETLDTLEGVPLNEWTHIALVLTALDGDQIIYQDGVQVALESVSNLTDATQSPVLRIGLEANVVLDDFRVWNYARTEAEIQADMNRELSGVEEGLVGYWRFNEGEGTTAYDMSPYENHGNITAAIWTTEAAPIEPSTPPVFASRPTPANGALLADTWVSLIWRAGDFAVSHDVYLGENFDDVNDGTGETFRGNQPLTPTTLFVGFWGYPYPDGLVPGTTYYWRIDEVNDTEPNSPWKGPVWSFMLPLSTAYNPDPADGAKFIDPNADLSWTAGLKAELHYVYFGDNFDDVNSADGAPMRADTTYTPGTLEFDKTYYWRVDESDLYTTQKGDVWSFKTLPDIPITDPNLVGWWTLDEGSGTIVLDRSGHGNHGTLEGDPQWVIGYDADALMFDGVNDFVEVPHAEILTVDNEVTVMAWIHTSRHGGPGGYQGILAKSNDPRSYSFYTQSAGTLHFSTTSAGAYVGSSSSSQVPLNEWVHVAAMVIGGEHVYYINGEPAGTGGSGINLPGTADTASVMIGRTQEGSNELLGMIDDVRIYNKALTQDEIQQVMRGDPLLAGVPNPANGSTPYIREATPLSWLPGDNAAQHDVYFGIDRDAVADANAFDTTGVYRGRQVGTSYTPPDVEWGGGPYYWRIDENNTDATISTGRIWSFTVADFIVIEDFEDYNDFEPDIIFDTWMDGWGVDTNGSEVGYAEPNFLAGGHFVETTIVHGGGQSMPYFYDTNFKYSEATYSPTQRNWTEEGVGVLSLWFRGNPVGFVENPAGTYTMSGAGTDIWDMADEFRYAYKQLSGDGEIVAQVLSVENTNEWAKAGVMIRESLDPGSKHAFVCITPGSGKSFQNRKETDLGSSNSNTTGFTAPYWVKLVRQGNQFTGYHSEDGVNWVLQAANTETANPETVSMATNVYIGLALTSHNSGVTCVAEFSDVETTGAVTPLTWTHEAIGATMAANDPALMYVALNGSAGVYHGNLNAPLIGTWTEWTIDLQEFTGVNLTNVNTLAIGFGDKNNLQPGGSGLVFFDDIRLYRPAPEPETP